MSLRLKRQDLLNGPTPPQVWSVIDEGALRRPVGGAAVMRAQLERLVEMAKLRHVTIQVVPFSRGGHAAAGGSFTVLRFSEPEVPDVVYIEQLTSALYLDKREDVDHYLEVMNHLSTEALTPTAEREVHHRDNPGHLIPARYSTPEGFLVTDVSSTPGEPDAAAGTGIDTTVPHSARIWNYWLGGKDNYAVDREAGDQYSEIFPGIVVASPAPTRAFLARAVRYLAGEAGIRQFLDIGTGLPTADNTHEVAQSRGAGVADRLRRQRPAGAGARPRPADQQPRGRHAITWTRTCRTPEAILETAAGLLDFTQPVALMFMGIMGHVTDTTRRYPIVSRAAGRPAVRQLLGASTTASTPTRRSSRRSRATTTAARSRTDLRSPEQFAGYFEGLELVEPGVVLVADWRPDPGADRGPEIPQMGGVGRKP